MSGFKALNIESDDESDIEVDDTKEIQIEDALKLYQDALKLHSQGPDFYDEAARAYEELFESEIFHYPESQAELRRIELYGPLVEDNDAVWLEDGEVGLTGGNLDSGSSTLPQILHLSHKNYAHFRLERLAAQIEHLSVSLQQVLYDATAALDHFVQALDKDDSDLDLWRRTATVGQILNSQRVARFCLEAVLDGDDEGLSTMLSLPGLEDSLALDQLRDLVTELDDRLSLLNVTLSSPKRQTISRILKQRLDPYYGIVSRKRSLAANVEVLALSQPRKVILGAPSDWVGLADVLLQQHAANQHSFAPASYIAFDVTDTVMSAAPVDPPMITAAPQPPKPSPGPIMPMPESISEQFSGLDEGKPTVQPQIADADANMQVVSQVNEEDTAMNLDSPTLTLPTRKRSGEAAGLADNADEGRAKSRRTRARESIPDSAENRQSMVDANVLWEYEQQLNERKAADDWLFETVGNLFERLDVVGLEAGKNVRDMIEPPTDENEPLSASKSTKPVHTAWTDLASFLHSYSDQTAHLLLSGSENLDTGPATIVPTTGRHSDGSSGFNAPKKLGPMPSDALPLLLRKINESWCSTSDIAYDFIGAMTRPATTGTGNAYTNYVWSEALKTMVVRTMITFDASIFASASSEFEARAESSDAMEGLATFSEMVQTIFELHLDIYCLIKEPNSGVDGLTVTTQSDRLQRWFELAREAMHARACIVGKQDLADALNLRFLWATTINVGHCAGVDQEYALECMQELRAAFVAAEEPEIYLQNNAIMPELSVNALDRKVSELTTRDFFAKVTENDLKDPAATIENLEPLLEAVCGEKQSDDTVGADSQLPPNVPPELVRFLESSSISVQLMLWQRLRDAYISINYSPMILSCYFRMIRLVLGEINKPSFLELDQADRKIMIVKVLGTVQIMITKAFAIVETSADAFQCIDDDAMRTTATTLGELLHLLQVFNVFEDSIQIGQTQPPMGNNGLTAPTFAATTAMIHQMQLRTWVILYKLFKDAVKFHDDLYPTPTEDKFDFLRTLHRNLGIRSICNGLNRVFVRMLKDEFFSMTHVEGYDQEQAQVLYDLYGLNCFINPAYELIEHGCVHDAFLDRGVAMQAVDLLLAQADKIPIKELVKHPLKDTIEKVHGALTRKKPTEAILRNRETCRAFLRSPINPLDLFKCLKGEGNVISFLDVPESDALLASKGWYFLMGHVALTKFRSQKKTTQTPTEDVDIAIAFFMQALEYSVDEWETWFRLGQAYDTKIDESVIWSAEKMNSNMNELVQLQRAVIHCHTRATALAVRSADLAFETPPKLTELYYEFGMRLYSSSREPFSMQAFAADETVRFLSLSSGMARGGPFKPLRTYQAWKLARQLFRQALRGRHRNYMLWTMLGKCQWKLHTTPLPEHETPPTAQEVLECCLQALKNIPGKKDSRDTKFSPMLEPHYKILSVVYKMVLKGSIDLLEARETMQHTSFARSVEFPADRSGWTSYVMAVLKNLRTADKQNWHHRMIYRAAQICYTPTIDPDAQPTEEDAIKAKHELTQQMFTKTFVLNVWRPETEREGRHFVYTTRYTRLFICILNDLRDRPGMEQLAKRVRRRPHELFEHAAVWQDICNAYLRLMRTHARLGEGLEMSTFSTVVHDDFVERKEPLERWMQVQENGENAALDALREVQELKKINQGLVKPGPIDDLIGDAYAFLFATVGKSLWEEGRPAREAEKAKQEAAARIVPPEPAKTMSLSSMMNDYNGANEQQPAPVAQPSTSAILDPAPARRKIGVGRREIRSAAENCFHKTPNQSAMKVTGPIPDHPRVQVVINASRPNIGDASAETSAPGSTHDSADDESELSELEEEEHEEAPEAARRPMFPGLVKEGHDDSEEFDTAEEDVDMDGADDKEEQEQDVPVQHDQDGQPAQGDVAM